MKAEILHVWKALHYSADGLIATFRNETAFRLELIMAVVLIPIALIPVSYTHLTLPTICSV